MPALLPSCAIAVSQLPRWPMVSLSLSWAEAGEAAASSAAAANATARWWTRVITVSLCSGEVKIARANTLPGWVATRNRALHRRVKRPLAIGQILAYVSGICQETSPMPEQRHVKLFRNGRNQAVRIPVEFELPGDEAIMHRDGDRLVIEPVRKRGLIALLKSMTPLDEEFPRIDDPVPP